MKPFNKKTIFVWAKKKLYRLTTLAFLLFFMMSGLARGQGLPELMYYKFDGSGTSVPNEATSPVGSSSATIVGSQSQGGTGQFGGALVGSGGLSTSDYVNTGWSTNFGTSDWTISFWVSNIASSTVLYYIFGDPSASGFRCFTNGTAGSNNWILRGPVSDIKVYGGATVSPHVIHFVYDSMAGDIKAYLDGQLNNTVSQGALNITSTGTFIIGGYSTNTGLSSGGLMDEFRVYNRALSATEIANTWNRLLYSFRDDAGISAVDSPVTPVSPGVRDVRVTLKNYGKNTLTSSNINWSVDGVTQTPYSWTGSLLFDSLESNVKIGSYNFPLGDHTIKAWTDSPNAKLDSNAYNDTAKKVVTVCDTKNGNYIIDAAGSGDYRTFNEALNSLTVCGVEGPVVFNVYPGTYNEKLVIPEIAGASASNTISFVGVNKHNVILTYAGTASSDRATLVLDGADYIIFKNITIKNTGSSYQTGVHFMNAADYNKILECNILVDSTTSSDAINAIMAASAESTTTGYADNANYNLIEGCRVIGGYYGIRFNGTSSSVYCLGNRLNENDIEKAYYYGVIWYYQAADSISKNTIKVRYSSSYGIRHYYGGGKTKIEANNIEAGYYGIYMYRTGYYGADPAVDTNIIVNNMIGNLTNSSQYGIYLNTSDYISVYHNSVWVSGTSTSTTYAAMKVSSSDNCRVLNNIFYSTGNTPCYYGSGSSSLTLDHNLYFSANGSTLAYDGSSYSSLSDWQSAQSSFNMNSISEDPQFVSATDLHRSGTAPYIGGTRSNVQTDIDGDSRCYWGPTLGADESTFPVPVPTANFATEDTICYNKVSVFSNTNGPEKKMGHFWYINGRLVSTDNNLSSKFSQLGLDTIKLVTYSCGGVDSIEKIVVVDTPKVISTPKFIADQYVIESGDFVNFTDLSTDCPLYWEWRVYPDSVYDVSLTMMMPSVTYTSGSAYTQNPEMIFTYPGKYDVCLWVDNGQGIDSVCKEDYISVKASYDFCQYAGPDITQSEIGLLFDDGGSTGDYGYNNNCSLFLEPCAKSMTLTFKEFDVANGDYLQVYDDQGGNSLWDVSIYPDGLTGATTPGSLGKDSIIYSPTGKLYIVWTTNGSSNASGFKAEWTSEADTFPAPTAIFEAQDTACVGELVHFEGTSTGQGLNYEWYFTNSGFAEAFSEDEDYEFLFSGNYPVKFSVSSACNENTAVYTKDVVVIQPNVAPVPNFTADNMQPVISKSYVTFEDLSRGCVDSWEWQIGSGFYTAISGFPNGQMPVVMFNDTDCYDVTLIAGYKGNYDTITKPCFIKPMSYCDPAVVNVNSDIGISKVKIGTINNATSCGIDKYTSYLSTQSTTLEVQASYPLTVERNTVNNEVTRRVWIDWNIDGDFNDTLELVLFEENARTLRYQDIVEVPVFATPGYSVMRVAVSMESKEQDECGPFTYGEVEDYHVVISPDRTAPIITLKGVDTFKLNQCDAYVDSGATAYDNINGNITSSIVVTNNLNASVPGLYTYEYNVSDVAGNDAEEVVRTIIVEPDTIGPDVIVHGKLIDSVEVYNSWIDPGYTASTRCVTVDTDYVSGAVDTSMIGEYEITYSATDILGNLVKAVRLVRVVDLTDPVIMLTGNAVDSVEVFDPYADPGVVITDNYYTGLTATVSGTVNTNVVGDYLLTYSVTDGSGNGPAIVTRTVKVVDTIAPSIFSYLYNDGDTVEVEVNTKFTVPKFNVSDNYYSSLTETEAGNFFTNFPSGKLTTLGVYTFVFNVEDGSGNVSTFTLYINGVDSERPEITLIGNLFQKICRFETLTDSAVVVDNYDQNLPLIIGGTYVSEYLQYMAPGYYTVTYDAVDQSGNKATQVSRSVEVLDTDEAPCLTGLEENTLGRSISVYPNPSKGKLNIDISLDKSTDINIIVTNALGQVVYKKLEYNVSVKTISLDLGLSNGIYNIRIQTQKESAVFPVVITR